MALILALMRGRWAATLLLLPPVAPPLAAQVAIHPPAVQPAAWERLALRVVNQADAAVVAVELTVPEVLQILGTDAPAGWRVESVSATDTSPPVLRWTGGALPRGAFHEFPLLVRVPADARRRTLVLPVTVQRSDGSTAIWGPGGEGRALTVSIHGTTDVSAWGAFAFAGAAMGMAVLALALAIRCGRRRA